MEPKRAVLNVVGTGIQAAGQLTVEARSAISSADRVFYLITDGLTLDYLASLNKNLESLHSSYESGRPRMDSYLEMVERILGSMDNGEAVCVALYGHPGVFAFPAHEAIRRARAKGYYARMFPGVSAEDCLFADLGVDPAWAGCQSFEATDFLIFDRMFDPRSALIIWQVGVIGDTSFQRGGYEYGAGLTILQDRLIQNYGPDHKVIVYEAAHYPIYPHRADSLRLADLSAIRLTPESTLFVPPTQSSVPNPKMLALLGISDAAVHRVRVQLLGSETVNTLVEAV